MSNILSLEFKALGSIEKFRRINKNSKYVILKKNYLKDFLALEQAL
jgi:hypothetical protein